LQKVDGSDRIVAVWVANDTFNIDLNFTDGITHRVAAYVMDWDNAGRSEKFDIVDLSNSSVLNTMQVSSFSTGKYLVWDLRGKVRSRVTRTAGSNAIVEGLFFDVAPKARTGSLKVKGANAQGLQLEVSGDTGVIYNIQASSDMKTWSSVGQLNLTTSPMTFTDSSTTGQQGLR